MKKKMVTYFCCAFLMFSSVSVFAKKGPPPPQNQPPPPGLPIDSGIYLSFIIGAAYGVYAIKKIKRLTIYD